MPTEAIQFGPAQGSGHEYAGGASPLAMNVVSDATGAVRRRPGVKTHSGATSGVVDSAGLDALHVASNGELYAVGSYSSGGRSVYRVTSGGSTVLPGGSSQVTGSASRPVVAETEAILAIAAGDDIQKVTLGTLSSVRLGGSPEKATHVVAQGGRLLANSTIYKGNVNWSGVATGGATAGHEQWGGAGTSGFFTAVGRPDPVVAVHENANEAFVFGASTMQVFSPDPSITYAAAATREYGCIAPYSVIKADDSFVWLDQRRRFVMSNGREYDDNFGSPIQRTLDEMSTVSDCFGYRVHLGSVDALVWTFPTDTRTFVFQKGVGWAQWAGWDSGTNNFKRLTVNCHHQRTDTGVNLVGTTAGKVGQFDAATYTDLGERISARVDTGFINRGTDKRKLCRAVNLAIRRASPGSANAVVGRLSWRDAEGEWENHVDVEMDGQLVYPLRSLGVYRRRQWRFEFSGDTEVVLVSATEEFRELDD